MFCNALHELKTMILAYALHCYHYFKVHSNSNCKMHRLAGARLSVLAGARLNVFEVFSVIRCA